MKDFLELVVRDASDGTSFRECQGARFNSHEIRYLKGEIIYVSSRGDVISFEEFEKLVYTAIVTKNRETCVRPFQLNVRSVRAREFHSNHFPRVVTTRISLPILKITSRTRKSLEHQRFALQHRYDSNPVVSE